MHKIDYIEIGNRIRSARKRLNITQEQAAERCDITASFYGHIERGDKKMSIETLSKIAQGLGISVDTILLEKNPDREQLEEIFQQVKNRTTDAQFNKYLSIIKAIAGIIDTL